MASIGDIISFVVTVAIFVGVIVGVVVVFQKTTAAVESTKASLREKGYNISDGGVSIKTNKRFNQEDYVDATQRGVFKAMGASSFVKGDGTSNPISSSPSLRRSGSNASTHSTSGSLNGEGSKKRHFFRKKSTGPES